MLIFHFTVLGWSAVAAVKDLLALRRSPKSSEAAIRYFLTWELLFVYWSCIGVADLLPSVGLSFVVLATVALMNVIVQPFSVLVCYSCISNLIVALMAGRIPYAGIAIPEATLQKYSETERRALFRHRLLISAVGLLVFGWGSFACLCPLLQLWIGSDN
jgi:hypothetical protein